MNRNDPKAISMPIELFPFKSEGYEFLVIRSAKKRRGFSEGKK
jgi:hypothetical protein